MIKYFSKNLESFPFFLKLKNELKLFDPINFRIFWDNYITYCKGMKRAVGDVSFREDIGAINVMGIKRDPEISFNLGDAFYNDVLVVAQNVMIDAATKDIDFYIYKVTMDPKDKKDKIAHLLLGMYNSYVRRPHRWIPTRTALCQDKDVVFIARTDSKGNVINAVPYKGSFSINIHDADKYINSSIGCTVLEKDSKDNGFHYKNSYKPLLRSLSVNTKDVVYAVSCLDMLLKIFYTTIEPLAQREWYNLSHKPMFKAAVDYSPPFLERKVLKWWWK